jgi:hypothetical protein
MKEVITYIIIGEKRQGRVRRPSHRRVDIIKMDLKETGREDVDWRHLT